MTEQTLKIVLDGRQLTPEAALQTKGVPPDHKLWFKITSEGAPNSYFLISADGRIPHAVIDTLTTSLEDNPLKIKIQPVLDPPDLHKNTDTA